jgi:2-polyprenyl-6-hydroxyphenyl methylase/3-demethylubiquinone-9 3-methyltransferase
MINFTPEGAGGEFFRMLAPYAPPPPPGTPSPVLWGKEEHVRALFGDRVDSLETTRGEYVERAASPREYYELFQQTFGPMVAILAGMAGQPERRAALERDFLDFIARSRRGMPAGSIEIPYEYLLVVARKRRG